VPNSLSILQFVTPINRIDGGRHLDNKTEEIDGKRSSNLRDGREQYRAQGGAARLALSSQPTISWRETQRLTTVNPSYSRHLRIRLEAAVNFSFLFRCVITCKIVRTCDVLS